MPSPSINPPSDTPPFSAPPGSADYTNDVTTIGNDYDTSPGTPPGASPELPVFVGGTPPPGAATPVAPPPTPLIYINIPPPPSPPVVLPAAAPPTPLIYLTPPPAPVTNASVPATPDASTLSLPQDCYNYIQQNSNGLTTCGALLSAGVTGCPQECLDFYSNVPSDCIASITENSANLAAIYNVPSNITDPASACGKVFNAAPRTAAPVMLIAAAAAGAALLVF